MKSKLFSYMANMKIDRAWYHMKYEVIPGLEEGCSDIQLTHLGGWPMVYWL